MNEWLDILNKPENIENTSIRVTQGSEIREKSWVFGCSLWVAPSDRNTFQLREGSPNISTSREPSYRMQSLIRLQKTSSIVLPAWGMPEASWGKFGQAVTTISERDLREACSFSVDPRKVFTTFMEYIHTYVGHGVPKRLPTSVTNKTFTKHALTKNRPYALLLDLRLAWTPWQASDKVHGNR